MEVGNRVNNLIEEGDKVGAHLHLSPYVRYGNLWASCYFAMTGFHAIHVLGGLVVFVIILVMAWRGNLQPHHGSMLELTGLYWHFVDLVWMFVVPFAYLLNVAH